MAWKAEFGKTPENAKKIQRFDDFKTVDWIDDTMKENKRQLLINGTRNNKRTVDSGNLGTLNVILSKYPRLEKFYYSCQSWLVLALTGTVIGLIAACLNIITQWLADIKTGHCRDSFYLNKAFCCWGEDEASCSNWVQWSGFGLWNYIIFVFISTLLAFSAASLVKHYAPFAAGSGISEIKVIVSGFTIEGFLDWWTLLIKSLGLPLAILSGLSVGKEGPSVHYAVCVGNCVSRLFDRFRRSHSNARHFLTAASAAGVAVLFGSPIGGVLFSIEEIANLFQLSTMLRSYFCCLVATSVLSAMNPFRTGQLVMFEVKYDQNWHFFEIPAFAILGAFGGVYGIVVSHYNVQWVSLRQKYLKNSAIKEVVLLASLTALVCYFCEFLRLDMTEGMEILFHECGAGDSDHRLCNYDRGQFQIFVALIYATLMRMVLVVVSYGCKVPCGIFVPSMAAGATFGRAIGILMLKLYRANPSSGYFSGCGGSDTCIVPGTYAFLGAGAALSGITHLTVAVVVIMFELTGALRYIIPTMIVVAVTKSINDKWGKGGIADQMIRFNGIPYIDAKEEHTFHNKVSKDAMTDEVVVLPVNSLRYSQVETILQTTNFTTYPIVSSVEVPILIGFIGRQELLFGIKTRKQSLGTIIPDDSVCVFAGDLKLKKLGIPVDSLGVERSKNESVIDFESLVNFAPITVDVGKPLESTLNLFHKIGPRLVFITEGGLLVGLMTRKDIVKYEIYLHEIEHGVIAGKHFEEEAWRLICSIDSRVRKLLHRAMGRTIAERYLRLSVDE